MHCKYEKFTTALDFLLFWGGGDGGWGLPNTGNTGYLSNKILKIASFILLDFIICIY